MTKLIEIVADGLRRGGFGGLFVAGTCGCKCDHLAPAGCLTDSCEPGHLHQHSTSGDWIISRNQEHPGDEKVQRLIDTCT
jgi:hypothetical protein